MMNEGKIRIGVFIAYNEDDRSLLEKYLNEKDVGCRRTEYEEAGLAYYVSQFSDSNLVSKMPSKIRVSFGDLTKKFDSEGSALMYVARQIEISRQQLKEKEGRRREILQKTNEKILRGEILLF